MDPVAGPSLASRRAMCALTVATLMDSWAAISLLDSPRPTRVSTSRSRSVMPSICGRCGGCRPAGELRDQAARDTWCYQGVARGDGAAAPR